jgi:hypothetical protein
MMLSGVTFLLDSSWYTFRNHHAFPKVTFAEHSHLLSANAFSSTGRCKGTTEPGTNEGEDATNCHKYEGTAESNETGQATSFEDVVGIGHGETQEQTQVELTPQEVIVSIGIEVTPNHGAGQKQKGRSIGEKCQEARILRQKSAADPPQNRHCQHAQETWQC